MQPNHSLKKFSIPTPYIFLLEIKLFVCEEMIVALIVVKCFFVY